MRDGTRCFEEDEVFCRTQYDQLYLGGCFRLVVCALANDAQFHALLLNISDTKTLASMLLNNASGKLEHVLNACDCKCADAVSVALGEVWLGNKSVMGELRHCRRLRGQQG